MTKISEKEFNDLTGVAIRVGRINPDSFAQRILAVLPEKGAVTLDEVVEKVLREGEDKSAVKKIKYMLYRLSINKNKAGDVKVLFKNDDDGTYFYKKNPDYGKAE
jgi:hypothetical protein